MLIPDKKHKSWDSFLSDEIAQMLNEIESNLTDDYNPTSPENILRFLTIDLNKVNVIWLGQDVYPAEGVATGRSFEVGGLENWNTPFRQVSLKNIVRLIHKTHFGITDYKNIMKFQDIQKEINLGIFPILQPNTWFNSLEEQGVLFLNTSFTCEIGRANSHKKIWENFSRKVITHISSVKPDVVWFLWGKEAISNKEYIQKGILFESRHPMMCSEKYDDDFLKSYCFKATMETINWLG
ncbi:uracil-DNA glycosylase [Brevibacillus brevis]|uniref:uracil-DNA glycosylase n=1 Tax=Brevibacillus brevis TaxID=1393 RepID=UPI0037C703F7